LALNQQLTMPLFHDRGPTVLKFPTMWVTYHFYIQRLF